ncbi:transport and Golgi organization protein 1 [Colletes gigas]|uniref:transport and Golgi organization protein 1 n=1 Tax=Colletes gigas TaxID=935657 RepID=UPI001C9B7EE4|nr:transport and Golgi organization protein 1 [Colletes gigas]
MTKRNLFINVVFLLIVIIFSAISPCLSTLSNERLCYDQECSVPISLARTTIQYHAKEAELLSFDINAEVTVYSKDAGNRTDLWGVEINGKRGYAPKNFLREYKILKKDLSFKVPIKQLSINNDNSDKIIQPKEDNVKLKSINDDTKASHAQTDNLNVESTKELSNNITVPYEIINETTLHLDDNESLTQENFGTEVDQTVDVPNVNNVVDTSVASSSNKEVDKTIFTDDNKLPKEILNDEKIISQEANVKDFVTSSEKILNLPQIIGLGTPLKSMETNANINSNNIQQTTENNTIEVKNVQSPKDLNENNNPEVPTLNNGEEVINKDVSDGNNDAKAVESNKNNNNDSNEKVVSKDTKVTAKITQNTVTINDATKIKDVHSLENPNLVETEHIKLEKTTETSEKRLSKPDTDKHNSSLLQSNMQDKTEGTLFSNNIDEVTDKQILDNIPQTTLDASNLTDYSNVTEVQQNLNTNPEENSNIVTSNNDGFKVRSISPDTPTASTTSQIIDANLKENGSNSIINSEDESKISSDTATTSPTSQDTSMNLKENNDVNTNEDTYKDKDKIPSDTPTASTASQIIDANLKENGSNSIINSEDESKISSDTATTSPTSQDTSMNLKENNDVNTNEDTYKDKDKIPSETPTASTASQIIDANLKENGSNSIINSEDESKISSDTATTSPTSQDTSMNLKENNDVNTNEDTYKDKDKIPSDTPTASTASQIIDANLKENGSNSIINSEDEGKISTNTVSVLATSQDTNMNLKENSNVNIVTSEGNRDKKLQQDIVQDMQYELAEENNILQNDINVRIANDNNGSHSIEVPSALNELHPPQGEESNKNPPGLQLANEESVINEFDNRNLLDADLNEQIENDNVVQNEVEDLKDEALFEHSDETNDQNNDFSEKSDTEDFAITKETTLENVLHEAQEASPPDVCAIDNAGCSTDDSTQNYFSNSDGTSQNHENVITEGIKVENSYWLTLMYLSVTVTATLIFSLGYYYIENMRRDRQLIAKINKLEKDLLISLKECTMLNENLKTTKDKLISIEDESFGSNEMVSSLKADLEAMRNSKAELEEHVAMVEKDLESATEAGLELERMLREVLSSDNEVNPLAQSVENLQTRLNAQQAANESLTNALNLKTQELEFDKLENESLSTELASFKKKYEELEVELVRVTENLSLEIKSKNSIEQTLSDKVQQLEMQIKEISTEKVALQKELKGKEVETKDLLDVINRLNSNSLDLDKLYDVSHIKAEAITLLEERNELQIQLTEIEGAHSLLEEHVKVIKEEVATLSEQCKVAEKEKKDAETRLEVLSNFFQEKEAQRQKEEAIWLQQQGEVVSTVERIQTMQNEIQNYKQQIEMLKREILDQEREYKNQISLLETKAHEQWVVARQVERRLEESKVEAGQLRNRLTLIEKNINEADSEAKLQRLEANREMATSPPLFMGAESSNSIMFSGSSSVPPPPPPSYLHSRFPPYLPPLPPIASGVPPYKVGERPPPLGGRLSSPPPMPLHPPASSRYDNAGCPPPMSPHLFPPFNHRSSPPPFSSVHIRPPPPPPGSILPPSWRGESLPPPHNFGIHPPQRERVRNHKGSLYSSGESLDETHHTNKD